jgi:hypothetical protein
MAIHGIGLMLVEQIFRIETEFCRLTVFPCGGSQVAQRRFTFARVEFGDLTELQFVALAGIPGKIIEDASAHPFDAAAPSGL